MQECKGAFPKNSTVVKIAAIFAVDTAVLPATGKGSGSGLVFGCSSKQSHHECGPKNGSVKL